VLVSPRCRGENTPFKIYTYLASGRPLVATRIPTHTQLLDDTLAWLVEPTPEGLAFGIREALARKEEARERAGREASPTVAIIDSQSVKGAEKGGPTSIHRASMPARRSRARSATSWLTRSACC
jgi:glycosyltransferase involved in cell wall biosynthesis